MNVDLMIWDASQPEIGDLESSELVDRPSYEDPDY